MDPLSLPSPATTKEKGETEAQWREYQDRLNRQLQDEGAASTHGSVLGGRSVVRSAMSGIEGDTFVETLSIAAHDIKDDDRDLTKCFDFTKHPGDVWKLPIAEMKETILDMVAANQIVVLTGATGCGKSTQVPQFILDKHARERKAVNILVTQPRKIAASSVARRVCGERGWRLGGLVGYQVRVRGRVVLLQSPGQVGLDKGNKSPDTRLLYVTTGILKVRLVVPLK